MTQVIKKGRKPQTPQTPLGRWLQEYMDKHGLARREFAKKTGTTLTPLSRLITGVVSPNKTYYGVLVRSLALDSIDARRLEKAYMRSKHWFKIPSRGVTQTQYDLLVALSPRIHKLKSRDAKAMIQILEKYDE